MHSELLFDHSQCLVHSGLNTHAHKKAATAPDISFCYPGHQWHRISNAGELSGYVSLLMDFPDGTHIFQ